MRGKNVKTQDELLLSGLYDNDLNLLRIKNKS